MENVNEKTFGIYFNEDDIRAIVEKHLYTTEVVKDQILCVYDVMNEKTPVGTSIIVGVDGIKCNAGEDFVTLIMSDGVYKLDVKVSCENEDDVDIHFEHTVPAPGTYGHIVDGVLDILTDEEKEFKKVIDDALGCRDDEYANAFRRANTRKIGSRSLILLEKIKAEINDDNILSENAVDAKQLVSVYIELTERYVNAMKKIEELNARHCEILESYKETYEEGSKKTRKLARDIDVINHKIESNYQIADFCAATINAAIMPILNVSIEA